MLEGVGVYIRRLSRKRHGTPKQAAKQAKDHGISFVAIMGCWQQPRKDRGGRVILGAPNKKRLKAYVDAFHAVGIKVGLWYYPWAGHEEVVLASLREQTEGLPISFWLNDAELGFKWKNRRRLSKRDLANQAGTSMRGLQPEAIRDLAPARSKQRVEASARILMQGVRAAKAEGLIGSHGSTAYGIAKFHPNFPWEVFLAGADWLSPQLYTATAQQVDLGIGQWYGYDPKGAHDELATRPGYMLPSIGTYGPKSGAKMHHHLSSFVDADEGVDGMIAWSWMQTNSQEWDTLARWADWFQRGACLL